MLFRRIRDHVVHQNWTAVAIDFLIVVLGVFVGTQVSNWNSNRLDLRRAHGYLLRISANLESDRQGMDLTMAYWAGVIRYGDSAIGYAERGEPVDGSPWKTVLAFYQASQMLPFSLDDTTYQELKSAGDLGLIRDEKLLSALAAYYVTGPLPTSPHLMRYSPEYRTIIRGHTPAAIADYIWKTCVLHMGEQEESFDPDCAAPVDETEAQRILDGYLAAPGLVPALRFWVTNQKVALQLLDGVRRDSAALAQLVEGESGR